VSASRIQGVAEIAFFVGCYCLVSGLPNASGFVPDPGLLPGRRFVSRLVQNAGLVRDYSGIENPDAFRLRETGKPLQAENFVRSLHLDNSIVM
jgi:hypothetical protein